MGKVLEPWLSDFLFTVHGYLRNIVIVLSFDRNIWENKTFLVYQQTEGGREKGADWAASVNIPKSEPTGC